MDVFSHHRYGRLSTPISQGAYGKVYQTDKRFAVKSIQMSDLCLPSAVIEIIILKKIRSKHIIELLHFESDLKHCYLVLPLGGSDLSSYCLEIKSHEQINDIFYKICQGVRVLHDNHIVDCDIRSDNIVMFGSEPKLIDFGLARLESDLVLNYPPGTCWMMPPESLLGYKIHCGIDCWSLGCLLSEMYLSFGKSSYQAFMDGVYADQVLKSIFLEFQESGHYPDLPDKFRVSGCGHLLNKIPEKGLLENILQVDIKKRFNINQILAWGKEEVEERKVEEEKKEEKERVEVEDKVSDLLPKTLISSLRSETVRYANQLYKLGEYPQFEAAACIYVASCFYEKHALSISKLSDMLKDLEHVSNLVYLKSRVAELLKGIDELKL